ncbi:MAG TPA: hypothetical protein GXZ59_02045 [Clostridiaceae bacterium]|nr:hypothetical protein [Clostridiaceae bacterium]
MSGGSQTLLSNLYSGLDFRFSLDIGVLISFLVCFVVGTITILIMEHFVFRKENRGEKYTGSMSLEA